MKRLKWIAGRALVTALWCGICIGFMTGMANEPESSIPVYLADLE